MELEGHIEVRRADRDAGKEYLIAGMCSCYDSGSQDVPGERRTYQSCTIAKSFLGHEVSKEYDRTTHGQSQAVRRERR